MLALLVQKYLLTGTKVLALDLQLAEKNAILERSAKQGNPFFFYFTCAKVLVALVSSAGVLADKKQVNL